MNKRLLYTATLLLALLIVASTATYAWFASGDTAKGMKYSIAKIDSSVILYRAIDDNLNGIPNLLEENVARSYYTEQYHFEQMGDETYALSEDSEANMLTTLDLQNLFPTQRYTFKYALTNRSNAPNRVILYIQGEEYPDVALLSTLSLRLGVVEAESAQDVGQPQWGEKIYFSDYIEGSTLTEFTLRAQAQDIYLDGMTGVQGERNSLDFWMQIEMESYDALAQRTNFKLTREQYNAMQGVALTLPIFYIYFEIVI